MSLRFFTANFFYFTSLKLVIFFPLAGLLGASFGTNDGWLVTSKLLSLANLQPFCGTERG